MQYIILHKLLACVAIMKKWEIIENDEYQMCSVRDDIEHPLIDCVIAKHTWQTAFPIFQINYMKCNEVVILGHIVSHIDFFYTNIG